MPAGIVNLLTLKSGLAVTAEDMLDNIGAIAAHPAYMARLQSDLVQPGLRIPMTASATLFRETVKHGKALIWLHTFGERFMCVEAGRPAGPPRLAQADRPTVPKDGATPTEPGAMPETMSYNEPARRLHVGRGCVDNVSPEVWAYQVSGNPVLEPWFSDRRKDRSRPISGDRRRSSPLGDIQPAASLAECTTELLNVLIGLGRLIALEPKQADLLSRACDGPLISTEQVTDAMAASATPEGRLRRGRRAPDRQGAIEG